MKVFDAHEESNDQCLDPSDDAMTRCAITGHHFLSSGFRSSSIHTPFHQLSLRRQVLILLLCMCHLSCHKECSIVGPTDTWHFHGGIIYSFFDGAAGRGSWISVINPSEASPAPHFYLPKAIEPRVSPDGKSLLFSRIAGPAADLFVSNLDGTGEIDISQTDTLSESWADWSPDGQKFVCTARTWPGLKDAIRVMNKDGSGAHNISDSLHVATYSTPRWSPAGGKIAFIGQDTYGGQRWLGVVSEDGTGLVRYGSVGTYAPVWSPNGRKIAYAGVNYLPQVLDLSSGLTTLLGVGPLAESSGYAWLLDGRLLYASQADSGYEISVVAWMPALIRTTVVSKLPRGIAIVTSFDSEQIAFIGRESSSVLSLYTVGMDGSGLRRVATVDSSGTAVVAQDGYIQWTK